MRAQKNIQEMGLEKRISPRLGNGLAPVKLGETEGLVLSGMGGMLMIEILEREKEKAKNFQQIILQPQMDIPKVRMFLHGFGFWIVEEKMVEEDGKFYTAINAIPGGEAPYSEKEYYFGRYLLNHPEDAFVRYLEYRKGKLETILERLNAAGIDGGRRQDVMQEYRMVKEVLEWI